MALSLSASAETEEWRALLSEEAGAVTLDEDAFATVRREMKAGCTEPGAVDEPAAAWRAAMNAAAGTESRDVLLLVLLTRLNPDKPLAAHAPLYTELLQLHSRALAGDSAACAELAAALRRGMWRTLRLPTDAVSADKLEARGAF